MSRASLSQILRHRCDRGATAVEYALLASLVTLVIVGAVLAMGTQLATLYQSVVDAFP